MRLPLILISFFLLLNSNMLDAQEASASVGKYVLKIGEQTELTLTAKPRKAERLIWPQLDDSLGGHFDVVKQMADTLIDSVSGLSVYKKRITITSFDSGFFSIQPFRFVFISQSGDTSVRLSDMLNIEVKTVQVDTTLSIKDIKDVQDIPFELSEYIPWFFGGLALAALLSAGVYLWIQRKRRKIPLISSEPIASPWEIALAQLGKIEKEKIWQQGKEKQYHSAITDVLRVYIEARFGIPAMESTSDEIISMCGHKLSDHEQLNGLKSVLQRADMVKFAKASPSAAEHELSLKLAVEFINATRPINNEPKEKEDENA